MLAASDQNLTTTLVRVYTRASKAPSRWGGIVFTLVSPPLIENRRIFDSASAIKRTEFSHLFLYNSIREIQGPEIDKAENLKKEKEKNGEEERMESD